MCKQSAYDGAGISMEGDEELLAGPKEEAPKREEWMTTLPPERKVILFIPSYYRINYANGSLSSRF